MLLKSLKKNTVLSLNYLNLRNVKVFTSNTSSSEGEGGNQVDIRDFTYPLIDFDIRSLIDRYYTELDPMDRLQH